MFLLFVCGSDVTVGVRRYRGIVDGRDACGRRRESGRQQRFAGRPVCSSTTALSSVFLQDRPGTVGGYQEILLGHPLDELVLAAGRRGRLGGSAGRGGRVECTLAAEVTQQSLPTSSPSESQGFEKGRTEFG